MSRRSLAAAAAALALSACTSATAPEAGALLGEPSSVAVFRGVTTRTPAADLSTAAVHPYRPYLAIANAASNDVSVVDGVDDSLLPAPIPLRGLVYPVTGRPLLLVAADLGDRKPDLLAVVTAGDLPWLGGSRLEVIRTWRPDGAVVGAVELGADVLAVAALPFDPAAPGSVTVVAALAGERIATVTFVRSTAGEGLAIDPAQATVTVSAPLGFQPVDLAVLPGDRTRVFAASPEPITGAVRGVAVVGVAGTPVLLAALDARAPTRLVAAARLTEAVDFTAAFGEADGAFTGKTPVDRVYAVLDESGCGLAAPIACGLVALDPGTGQLLADPTPAGTMQMPFRAPIPVADVRALGVTGPPAVPPTAAEPQYAGTYLRVQLDMGWRQTTAVAALAAAGGAVTYVDLARWDVPSQHAIFQNVTARVLQGARPAGAGGTQFLTLAEPGVDAGAVTTIGHLEAARLTAAVQVTGGYTPSDDWIVTREGALPGLAARRAQAFPDGSLALQGTDGAGEVVRVWDPTLGVRAGDLVVIEPTGLGTCKTFEASIAAVNPPDATRPGGSLALAPRTPAVPAWDRCLEAMKAPSGARYLATIRAGDHVLVRGTGAAAVHVGRPELGKRFEVAWQDEAALAATCPLPPAVAWQSTWSTTPPSCDADCRLRCELLQRVRLARRIGYVNEGLPERTGPALAFILAREVSAAPVPRDLALLVRTIEGRDPFRVLPTAGSAVSPRAVVPFDRSPWAPIAGVRFLVPYAGGAVMDTTPTLLRGSVHTIH